MATANDHPIAANADIGGVYEYGPVILWERTVQIAVADFCSAGGVVLDIGSNIGGVAIALSRMVGLTGQVHAFECNPRLAAWNRSNVLVNAASNVTLIEKAVFSKSGETVSFFCEPSHFGTGSSLLPQGKDSAEISVSTISIDDYCRANGLKPDVIKIDVEGSEYDVLLGAEEVLSTVQPVVVYEDIGLCQPDRDPIDFMTRLKYKCYDVSLYKPASREFYNEHKGVSNVLCIPERLAGKFVYNREFVCAVSGSIPVKLPTGRYVLECEIRGDSTEQAWIRLVNTATGCDETNFETKLSWLKHHTSSALVVNCTELTEVKVEIGARAPIEGLELGTINVYRINVAGNFFSVDGASDALMNHHLAGRYRFASAMVPYYSIGRILLPDDKTSGIVVPIDGEYVVQSPLTRQPYAWLLTQMRGEMMRFAAFAEEMKRLGDFSDVDIVATDAVAPHMHNGYFSYGDALALTTVLTKFHPGRYVEIGSGNSTRFARRAITKYGLDTTITCIDPNPRSSIGQVADFWIERSVLDADLGLFGELHPGDVLFLDGSHLVFHGTDTTHVFLRIFPLLKPGVIVHVHDIHLPYEYPSVCDRLYWNEQYILAAMLMNRPAAKLIAPVKFMEHEKLCPEGASFWFEM